MWLKFKAFIFTKIKDVILALYNNNLGMSSTKLFALALIVLIFIICIKYTTADNLAIVLGILVPAMITLTGINKYANQQQKKLEMSGKAIGNEQV